MACETVVIGLNWVGDNVLALPAYKALQHRFRSEGGIAVVAPGNVAPLLEVVDDLVPVPSLLVGRHGCPTCP